MSRVTLNAVWPWRAAFPLVLAGILLVSAVGCQSPQIGGGTQAGPVTRAEPAPVPSQQRPPVPPSAAVPPPADATLPPLPGTGPLSPYLSGQPGVDTGAPQRMLPALPPSDAVRVAFLAPLTGPNAGLGQAMLNAAQLAVFDFAGSKFELLVHDTAGTPEGAAEAAAVAIADGASLILGPLLSTSVEAVAPAARAAGVPVIAFSSRRAVAGDGVYTLGFLPSEQVRRVANFALNRGVTRFAALAPDTEYGRVVTAALQQVVEGAGGTVTRVLFYDPAETDFAPVVKDLADYDRRARALETQRAVLRARGDVLSKRALARLKNLDTIGDLPFQALLLPDGGKRLQAVAAHLPFYDIDPAKVHMLGTGRWDTPGLGAEPALLGGWFAAPPLAAREEFQAQYAGVYGAAPPRLATLAYDAAALAAVLAQGDGARDEATGLPRPDFSHATLTDPAGYYGRDGVFRFLDDGTAERGLAVMEVGDHMNTVLSPAPETFTVN